MRRLLYGLLGRITKRPQEQRNIISLGLNLLIKNADTPLFTGTELQAFQYKMGLDTGQMGLLGSCGQITQAIATFSLMGFSDRVRNRVRANAWLTAGMATYPLALLVMALGPAVLRTPAVGLPVMAGGQIAESAVIALIGMIFATLFVRTIGNEIRGRFMGIIGVAGGLVGVVFGLISSQALRVYGYPSGFAVAFGMAVVLLGLATWAVRHVRELPELNCAEVEVSVSPFHTVGEIIRTREFKLLAPPNILRGLGDGAGGFAMAMGMSRLHLGAEYAGYTTSLSYLGAVVGTALIGFAADRYGPGRVLFSADTMIAVSLMGLILSPSPIVFVVFFFLLVISSTVEGYTVPLAHYWIVPAEIIGSFSGARLMILYGTAAITTWASGSLMKTVNPVWVFGGCALLKIATGILYWYAFEKGKKDRPVCPTDDKPQSGGVTPE